MSTFHDIDLSNALRNALDDLGFEKPTPIQERAFSLVRSGRNVIGISQTGTGKTTAYMLPILRDMKFSKQVAPRVLILVPTRELVVQLVEQIEELTKYMTLRILGVYGGTNLNVQAQHVAQGVDILVATPGRLYDLAIGRFLKLKSIQKLVIDEVDVMLDLGFRPQLQNIFELLPEKRQNLMFSATMTEEVEELIKEYFVAPEQIAIAPSGTPLDSIEQLSYAVPNFYTKVNLLAHLLKKREVYKKVLVFTSSKKEADLLFEELGKSISDRMGIIHSNRSQNARLRAIEEFESGKLNILIATEIIARGLDFGEVTHVINLDTPTFPENYIHRIGRTGRAESEGESILLFTEKEEKDKKAIEELMSIEVPVLPLPDEVEISSRKTAAERPDPMAGMSLNRKTIHRSSGPAVHEKSEKNSKENLGGSYRRKLAAKYKKPKTRGDKNANRKRKGK